MPKYKYDTNFYDFTDKQQCVRNEVDYMLIRTMKMFRWKNLPDSINKRTLELWLQTCGAVFWTDKPDGILRVFFGGFGGEPDVYYRPTIFTLANPALNYSAELAIIWDKNQDGDGVIMCNDSLRKGLLPMHRKFSSQIVENEISLKVSCINSRMPFLLSADDERTRKSAEQYLINIEKGKIGVVDNAAFLEGIKEHQLGNQTHMVFNQLVEHNQYIRSTWYAQLGLNSMFNMKKEAISDAEKQMSEDELLPLIDEMLEERKYACELINEKFGTDISVEFDSSWEDNIQEIELNHEVLEAEANVEDNDDDGVINTETDSTPEGNMESADDDEETSEDESSEDEEVSEIDDESTGDDGRANIDIDVEINVDSEPEGGESINNEERDNPEGNE